ncbi:MAG: hypothetical protein PHF11_07870 [Candidatus Omnitrophica bacterium]|nr:hypothetical protein [Candidatus Omnitrophota bacterium]
MAPALFIRDIYGFYRHDCCWPYAASFFLVLVIYWLDFFVAGLPYHWASLSAYGTLLVYYLYSARLYSQGRIRAKNTHFFMGFLSFKIILWGALLVFLYLIRLRFIL